jgi:exosortase A-associated hydrolase 2
MAALQDTPFEAHFLEGGRGRLFALYFPAMGEARGKILCVPPFTEESNRCRVMLGMGARALAQQGYATLLLDLYGTGDSEGEFEQADWAGWLEDVRSGVQWLSDKPGPLTLWGTRLGAVLATDAAQALPGQVARLLFWQPVSKGKQMFTQYLRLRVANSLEAHGRQETTNELRAKLAGGEALEVGGYYIAPRLAADLDAVGLPAEPDLPGVRIDWLERVDEGKTELAIASKKLLDSWQAQGCEGHGHPFTGPPFWQLHERFLAPQLVDLTCRVMEAA